MLVEIGRLLPRPRWAATYGALVSAANESGVIPRSIRQLRDPNFMRPPIELSAGAVRESIRALENLRLIDVVEGIDATCDGFGIVLRELDADRVRELATALAAMSRVPRCAAKRFADELERRSPSTEFWADLAPHFRGLTLDASALLAQSFCAAAPHRRTPSEDANVRDPPRFQSRTSWNFVFRSGRLRARTAAGDLRWVRRAMRPDLVLGLAQQLLIVEANAWPLWNSVHACLAKVYGHESLMLTRDGRVDVDASAPAAVEMLAILQRAAPEGTGTAARRAEVAIHAWYCWGRMHSMLGDHRGVPHVRLLLRKTRPGEIEHVDAKDVLPRLAGYFLEFSERRGTRYLRIRNLDSILSPDGFLWPYIWRGRCTRDGGSGRDPVAFIETLRPCVEPTADDASTRDSEA